jgi:hypothetical protein
MPERIPTVSLGYRSVVSNIVLDRDIFHTSLIKIRTKLCTLKYKTDNFIIFLGGDGLLLEVNFSINCFMKKQEDNLSICPTKYLVSFFLSVKGLAHEIILEALMGL